VFSALGEFPLVPLMEDYDLVQRVRRLGLKGMGGRVCLVPDDEEASEDEDECEGEDGVIQDIEGVNNGRKSKQRGMSNKCDDNGKGKTKRSLRVVTSARRWEEYGVVWTTVMNQVSDR
jgi:hypothetical protein